MSGGSLNRNKNSYSMFVCLLQRAQLKLYISVLVFFCLFVLFCLFFSSGGCRICNYFARLFPRSWGVFFSHPADYTPVCTTELGAVAKIVPDFQKRNTKVIGLSCDPVESHKGWIKDIQAYNMLTGDFPYPLIADPKRELAVQLGMIDPEEKDKAGLPLTCRAVSKVIIPFCGLRISPTR